MRVSVAPKFWSWYAPKNKYTKAMMINVISTITDDLTKVSNAFLKELFKFKPSFLKAFLNSFIAYRNGINIATIPAISAKMLPTEKVMFKFDIINKLKQNDVAPLNVINSPGIL